MNRGPESTIGGSSTPFQSIGPRALLAFALTIWALGLLASGGQAAGAAVDTCPNAAIRKQQNSGYLPGCRAYEIVNPPAIDVGEVNRVSNISDDGSRVAYLSVIPSDQALGGPTASASLATRGPGGWSSLPADMSALGPVYNQSASTVPRIFNSNWSQMFAVAALPGTPADVNNLFDSYLISVGTGASELVAPGPFQTGQDTSQFAFGASTDLSRVVFLHQNTLPTYPKGIFAWHDGQRETLFDADAFASPITSINPAGGGSLRGLNNGIEAYADPWVEHGGSHGVSADGKVVYFSFESLTTPLMVSNSATGSSVVTAVSASHRPGEEGELMSGRFISASHDGSVAYFTSSAQLTPASTPGGGIYRFDLATGSVTQITPDSGDPGGPGIVSATSSDDQSHIYFTATTAMAPGATAGQENAYLWTAKDGVRFLATVGAGEKFERVSRNGRFALLTSSTSIEGAPNNGHSAVYEYDEESGKFSCASCRNDGSASAGNAELQAQSFGFLAGAITHPRNLTDDGAVFFDSTDRIVAADKTTAMDVYEYRDGKVSLISNGNGDSMSFLADNSDNGEDVFVITRAALVGADQDANEFDVYDAKARGGFLEPESQQVGCQGDGCQGPPLAAPAFSVPGSTQVENPRKQQTKKRHKKHQAKKHHEKKRKGKQRKRGAGRPDRVLASDRRGDR